MIIRQAMAAHVAAINTWIHTYMPWEPSGLKITMIHVENPAIAAMAPRDCSSGAAMANGQL
ncbi:Uncharacterised protein [Mycobacteroides abscessus subsp. abscessus]|nr:Uncharacterised protein [Mycobacteroides abscessus subsp. abscessus]